MKTKIITLILIIFSCHLLAQDRFDVLEEKLNQLAKTYPGINEKVELSVNGVSLQEFVRAIGTSNNLNISIDPAIDFKLNNNFKDVTAKDVFIFLCKRYDLDISFVGPIITFVKYVPVAEAPKTAPARKLDISYEPGADLLSYDLKNDTIGNVLKEITKLSGKNIVFVPELANKLLVGYVQNSSFKTALDKLALSNDIRVSQMEDGFFVFEKKLPVAEQQNQQNASGRTNNQNNPFGAQQNNSQGNTPALAGIVVKDGLVSVDVVSMPINDVVNSVSKQLGRDYFLFSDLKGNTTVKINDATYDDFLKMLFNGTEFTFKKQGNTYLLGDRNLEGLRVSKLISLKNRTIDKVLDLIPAELKKGVDLKTFKDLNGFIVSGSQPRILELETFLRQIDMVVPMVHIEVIIADIRKSNTLAAGISAGLGSAPVSSSIGVLPGIDATLGANSINNLINGINGFGVINLGNVTPNFYLTIKALESQGILKTRSTPQIATLNGHEAKISIGQTQYYLEVQNQVLNNLSQQQNLLQTQQYKSVNADLSITIDPQVSGDEQITMTINVKQSTFTERITNTAPPGTINRDFQSLIRVKNGEMIMLGGLEENITNHSGKGLPGLSRIPVLRWIFGDRTKSKTQNKLTIFIKPTIIYS